jgi:hypothetical protein
VLCGSLFMLGLVAGLSGLPTSVSATSPPESTADLVAARFVVVVPDVLSVAGQAPMPSSFEIWVDGRRRVGGLSNAFPSPFVLLSPGERTVEVRAGNVVLYSKPVTMASGSSTTFVVNARVGGSELIRVADLNEVAGETPLRLVNLTDAPVAALIGSTPVTVAARSASESTPSDIDASPKLTVSARPVPVDRRDPGAKLVLIRGAASGGAPLVTMFSATRYPAASLHMGNLLAPGESENQGHTPEFWLRRILSAFVVILVVAATLATLRSFRTQALESRVRARME